MKKNTYNLLFFGVSVTVILVLRSQFYSKDSIRKENRKTLTTIERILSEQTMADVCEKNSLDYKSVSTSKEEKSFDSTVKFIKKFQGDNPLVDFTTGTKSMNNEDIISSLYVWLAIWIISLICDITCCLCYCVRCFCGACCKCCNRKVKEVKGCSKWPFFAVIGGTLLSLLFCLIAIGKN